jgi:hypothetical protein
MTRLYPQPNRAGNSLVVTPTNGAGILQTVDDFRVQFMNRFVRNFNFENTKVVKRNFNVSRDKRTLEWDFELEELPYQPPPAFMQTARGSYSVKQEKSGPLAGAVKWICTLRATYVVPKGMPRNIAFRAFTALWAFRMAQAANSPAIAPKVLVLPFGIPVQVGGAPAVVVNNFMPVVTIPGNPPQFNGAVANGFYNDVSRQINNIVGQAVVTAKCLPIQFSAEEGLYLDSRTVTFQASWRVLTSMRALLAATGMWARSSAEDRRSWAQSIRPISGGKSWTECRLEPADALIVDFGS